MAVANTLSMVVLHHDGLVQAKRDGLEYLFLPRSPPKDDLAVQDFHDAIEHQAGDGEDDDRGKDQRDLMSHPKISMRPDMQLT